MIGVPYNPDKCIFITSQAINANQFDPNVPDAGNLTTHNLLFDTVNNSLIWVDTKTNLIVQETSGGGSVTYEHANVELVADGLGDESLTISLNNAPPIALSKRIAIGISVAAPATGTIITDSTTGATGELGALITGSIYELINVTAGGFYTGNTLTWPGLVGPATVTSSFIGFSIPTTKQLKYATITSGDALNGSFGKSNGVNNDCVIQSALGTAASFTQSIYVETKSEGYKGGINNVTSNSFNVFLQKTSVGTSMSMSFDIQE